MITSGPTIDCADEIHTRFIGERLSMRGSKIFVEHRFNGMQLTYTIDDPAASIDYNWIETLRGQSRWYFQANVRGGHKTPIRTMDEVSMAAAGIPDEVQRMVLAAYLLDRSQNQPAQPDQSGAIA